MRVAVRLTFRLYRFELSALALASLVLGAAAALVVLRLNEANPSTACIRAWVASGGDHANGCRFPAEFFARDGAEAGRVMAAMALLPLAIGIVAGSMVVAREIEQRTAQLAWSVATSRRRWLLDRLVPILAFVALATAVPAISAEVLESARVPWVSALASAHDYGLRGPIAIALALTAFGVAALVGSVLGRVLPTLLVAVALVLGGRSAVDLGRPFGEPIVVLDPDAANSGLDYPMVVDTRYRADDGTLVDFDQALRLASAAAPAEDAYAWVATHLVSTPVGVPAADVWRVELREVLLLLGIGAVSLVTTAAVVERRRPY